METKNGFTSSKTEPQRNYSQLHNIVKPTASSSSPSNGSSISNELFGAKGGSSSSKNNSSTGIFDSVFAHPSTDTRLVYKHYATLYFVFVFDDSENELAMLDLIQVNMSCRDWCGR
ncbi:hypothetical protein IFM89_004367 [Coptis chinensis]|uniref:AP complex mu/sigma subunit domain-containing protein n=1 Tax=Coptis chinensis TaxID=261450 RepID=A0A835IM04_9MAGN|nr:hypothetical protein IFM89_004367 [Coptis chinensis]